MYGYCRWDGAVLQAGLEELQPDEGPCWVRFGRVSVKQHHTDGLS